MDTVDLTEGVYSDQKQLWKLLRVTGRSVIQCYHHKVHDLNSRKVLLALSGADPTVIPPAHVQPSGVLR